MSRSSPKLMLDPPYDKQLEGILGFATFRDAEDAIHRLAEHRREYMTAGDKKGLACCRRLALIGRRRAELIARNRKVRPEKRLNKQEIADWFRVWLETPELFEDWLAMRKATAEFQRLLEIESMSQS